MADQDIPDRFAEYRRHILELRLSDPIFAEIWTDYCDVLKALEPIQGEATELQRLRTSLEAEITQALGGNSATGKEAQDDGE